MGPEIAAAAPYLLGGGAVASLAGQHQQQKERRKILNRSMERTSRTQDQATDLIQGEGRKFAPEQRMQDMQAQEEQTYDQQRKDIGAALPDVLSRGNVSADYLKASADKALSEGNRLTAVAREIAKARAPGQQLQAEGMRTAGVMGDVGSRWGSARNLADAAQNQAASVEEPWWGQLGKIAQTIGGANLGTLDFGGSGLAAGSDDLLSWLPRAKAVPRIRFGAA